jgi:SAM-dependent methyltransferase
MNRVSERIKTDIKRMRLYPKIYDYCYFSALTNVELFKMLFESIDNSKVPLTIIDLGCGTKVFDVYFDQNVKYVGIDFTGEASADILSDLGAGIPVANKVADIVILSETLEHIPDPFLLLTEISRILKTGGSVFISTPFAFPIHGRPFDFFRYTEFFYKYVEEKYDFKLEHIKQSNCIFTTPLLLVLQILLPLPFIPYKIKQMLSLLVNIIVFVVEFFVKKFFIHKVSSKTAGYLRAFPLGYALIFTKSEES